MKEKKTKQVIQTMTVEPFTHKATHAADAKTEQLQDRNKLFATS